MQISLLSNVQPFSLLRAFAHDKTNDFVVATYAKVMTHEDEQSITAVTEEHLIRLREGKDGWKMGIRKKDPYGKRVVSCSILPEDIVVVAMERKFYFYLPWLELLSVIESNDIVDGLTYVTQFKPLVHTQEPEFVIIS